MADIKAITLPDGTTYNIKDDTSGYATLNSPAFTGTPTAPTPTSGDDSTNIATTAFVQDAVSGAGGGTVMSVGVSNATNGGLSVSGSPITSSGTITIGHSNILGQAYSTLAFYPIQIDKNGHITSVGPGVYETQNSMTGISISDHSTSSIYGVQSTTTSVTGVQSSTTTASKVTLGTNISVPNVTGSSDVTVPIRDDSDVTVPIAASSTTTVPIKNASATTIPTAASSATSCDDITAWDAGSGSLTFTMDTTDTKKLVISHSHTAPSLSYTSRSITGVSGSTSIYGVQSSTTSVTGVSGSTSVRGVKTGTSSTTTASKVTLGTAISVPNVTGATDVTVPIKNTSATTVPIKNASSTSVVTSATHSITDTGHRHDLLQGPQGGTND